jgi:hypothetical protein
MQAFEALTHPPPPPPPALPPVPSSGRTALTLAYLSFLTERDVNASVLSPPDFLGQRPGTPARPTRTHGPSPRAYRLLLWVAQMYERTFVSLFVCACVCVCVDAWTGTCALSVEAMTVQPTAAAAAAGDKSAGSSRVDVLVGTAVTPMKGPVRLVRAWLTMSGIHRRCAGPVLARADTAALRLFAHFAGDYFARYEGADGRGQSRQRMSKTHACGHVWAPVVRGPARRAGCVAASGLRRSGADGSGDRCTPRRTACGRHSARRAYRVLARRRRRAVRVTVGLARQTCV